MRVIVTGAAGHLGRLVAEQLLERLEPDELVLVTRRPDALRECGGATVRYGDFDDPASLGPAFQGGDRMLLIGTDALGRRARQHRAAIEAAARAGIRHVVFTSIVNPVAANPLGSLATEAGRTEAMLEESGMDWTMLRFGSFAELALPPAATAVRNGRLLTNAGNGRLVSISRADCAEAAAVVLTSDGHAGATYDITGSEAFTARDHAKLYANLSQKLVRLVPLTDAMLTSVLVGIGTPLAFARDVTAFGRAVRLGYFDVVDPAFERLTGRTPATLRDVLLDHRADLLAVA
jgi:NAD(P)H dehydrogenase (quinone)